MRTLGEYGPGEIARGKPLAAAFKTVRNAVMREAYCRKQAPGRDEFVARLRPLAHDRTLAITIAFEQPWLLEMLLPRFDRLARDAVLAVCDNSRTPERRREIVAVCEKYGVAYLALPPNPVRHVDRSHGNALNWAFCNVVRQVRPKTFAFLDHDLFPPGPFELAPLVANQPAYGVRLDGINSWALWAGFCVFDFGRTGHLPLDFYPDSDRRLFTGGRNFTHLYRHLDADALKFAKLVSHPVREPGADGKPLTVGLIDGWVHLSGASWRAERMAEKDFFAGIVAGLEDGDGG